MSRFAAMRRSFDDSGDGKQPPNLPSDPIPTPQFDPHTGEYVPAPSVPDAGGGGGGAVDPTTGAQPRGMLGNSLALNGQYAPVTLADYLAASHGSLLSNSFVPQNGGMVGGAFTPESTPGRFGYAANGMTVVRPPSGGYTQGMSNVDSYIGMGSGTSLEGNQAHTKEAPEADRPPPVDPGYTPPKPPRQPPVDPNADPVQPESKYKRLNDSFGGF